MSRRNRRSNNYGTIYRGSRSRRRRQKRLETICDIILVLIIMVLFAFVFKSCMSKDKQDTDGKKEEPTTVVMEPETEPIPEVPVERPIAQSDFQDLSADAELSSGNIAVVDVTDHKLLAGKNADVRMYPASMTKVMTLIVAVENLDDLKKTHTYTTAELDPLYREGASMAGFVGGEVVTAEDMLYALVLPSGADGAVGIATLVAGSEQAFVDLMNKKVEELGLKDTHFMNTSGLHDPNHYTTAVEQAMIMEYAMKNEICAKYLSTHDIKLTPTPQHPEGISLVGTLFKRIYGDREIPGVTINAGKTGFTNEATHTLVTYATSGNKNYICVTAACQAGYWYTIYDDFKLYVRYCEGYTGEGVILRSGEVIVQPLPEDQRKKAPETTTAAETTTVAGATTAAGQTTKSEETTAPATTGAQATTSATTSAQTQTTKQQETTKAN